MKPRAVTSRGWKTAWLGGLAGAAITVLASLVLLLPIGDPFARLSYDLPFLLAQSREPDELVIVYLDSATKVNLKQPTDVPLDWSFYTQLLERLTREGARLVLFDILLDQAHADSSVDAQFAEAIRKHARVVLVSEYQTQLQGNVFTESPIPPIPVLTEAAAGWGLARVFPDPADNVVRRIDTGVEDYPAAGWVGATLLGADTTSRPQSRLDKRWLNYYCQPGALKSVELDFVLLPPPDGPPEGFFRDKIVVVGARPAASVVGVSAVQETFSTPFTRFEQSNSTGAAIHALTLLNLLHGDWMMRLGRGPETVVLVLWGVLISCLLMAVRPWVALIVAAVCFVAMASLAAYFQIRYHVWFAWFIPAGVQTPLALIWSVGFQYVVESRRRRRLRQAFAAYLSPYMADRIADSDFDLSPGGTEIEATVMFADLAGFTKMSETLAPTEVSKILTAYFNQTTRFILKENATIIKYIGDAVLAAWGVPLSETKHADRAVQAALAVKEAGPLQVEGHRLRTRIGISTGLVLAGNLGSDFRFDYTVIGDTTNFASRLEGLNKHLGTEILISESTQRQLSDGIKLRYLGRFIVEGKAQPVGIYEVLGRAAEFPTDPPWLTAFTSALELFVARNFDDAERMMQQVLGLRDGDGPAKFYLEEIARTRARLKAEDDWDETVILKSK